MSLTALVHTLTASAEPSLWEEIWTYLVDKYFTMDWYSYQYNHINVGDNGLISIRTGVAALLLGVIIASALAVFQKRTLGDLVRAIDREWCVTPESAKTLTELGLIRNTAIKNDLRYGRALRRVVRCAEEEAYIMSIPAVKCVEIGAGEKAAELTGSNMHDEIFVDGKAIYRKTNNAGGIEGGMTNGESIIVKGTMKAIPTMRKPLSTVDLLNHSQTEAHFERSDTCAVPACAVVAEARIATVLVDEFLRKFGSDNLEDIKKTVLSYE